MQRIFLLTSFFLASLWGIAQPENGTNNKKIFIEPQAQAPEQKAQPSWIDAYLKQRQWRKNNHTNPNTGVDFTGERQKKYYQPTYELPPNLQKDLNGESSIHLSLLKGDQFFGDFISGGASLNVYCRDHGAIDGDKINIWVNDELVVENIYLGPQFKGVYVPLSQGFNKIEFEAINQGSVGPNTAEFRVIDEQQNTLINEQWQLLTGYKARFIVVKQ